MSYKFIKFKKQDLTPLHDPFTLSKEFTEGKEKIKDVLTEKILYLTKELEALKEELEKLK